jgi:hypothetical protein
MSLPRSVEEWCGADNHREKAVPYEDYCFCEKLVAYAAGQVAQARAEEREACANSSTAWVNDFFDTKPGSDPGSDVIKGILLERIAAIRAQRDEE